MLNPADTELVPCKSSFINKEVARLSHLDLPNQVTELAGRKSRDIFLFLTRTMIEMTKHCIYLIRNGKPTTLSIFLVLLLNIYPFIY